MPPLRGLLSKAKLGVVPTSNFTDQTAQLQTCDNPRLTSFGSPLIGGTRVPASNSTFTLQIHH